MIVLSKGGRIGIYSSLQNISSDCQLLSPTAFGATPVIFNSFHLLFKQDLISYKQLNPTLSDNLVKSAVLKK